MTEEQWGLFVTGVLVGVAFCGSAAMGAIFMFRTIMRLQSCGFNIAMWRSPTVSIDTANYPRHNDNSFSRVVPE